MMDFPKLQVLNIFLLIIFGMGTYLFGFRMGDLMGNSNSIITDIGLFLIIITFFIFIVIQAMQKQKEEKA